ncbi:predicted protein [Verticillium alfalfae VaMs.102]|uniref:Predicted protein n=1 Tax=Verticillium alfalfae (strain VaMs.102 / ATCC MYA-4576 / FGSC 10136) TaxID=526221 RepID=C9SF52_VERA1|nr:predicted protein [Verticillium alfalfae VaMs.102]EEY17838.1 predicted protein [Verticillium alfalfae VaMs.102]
MTGSDNHDNERDPQNDGYRGIRSCSTHAEALAAMEEDLDSRRTGENAELKSEVALLLRDFYDKIDKYAKPPAAHRDIVYVRSIKKALEAAIQYREAGEAFSHRLPSSAQMLALRYTHQSGTLEEDVCAVLVDYQVKYGAPVPFLGFGYTAKPVHELLLATPVQPPHVIGEHEPLLEQQATPFEDMKDRVERREEQQSEQNDVASRTMKLRQDLQGLREMTAETTTAQRAEIDALKTDREENAHLLSILLRQMQEYRRDLRLLKVQVAVPTPPLETATSVLDKQLSCISMLCYENQANQQYLSLCEPLCVKKNATTQHQRRSPRQHRHRNPATLRSSTTPSNATVQPEKTTHTASSVRSPGQNFPTAVNPKRAEPPRGQKPAPKTRPPLDPNSKEYKKEYNSLTRRWTAGLIAMPILLVTSYYLFDRIILGHEKKELHRFDSSKNPDESPIKSF